MAEWCTIESDPGVFTELVTDFGVRDIEFEESYSLETCADSENVYGFIFLFKWKKGLVSLVKDSEYSYDPRVYFAKQIVHNACATQAILSILLNSKDIMIGKELTDFKAFTLDMTPELRGMSIGGSEFIRTSHNKFAPPHNIIYEQTSSKGEAFHFVSFVPIDGVVYELDGLKQAPRRIGEYDIANKTSWVQIAFGAIQTFITSYTGGEIRFNLLALRKSRKSILADLIQSTEEQIGLTLSLNNDITTLTQRLESYQNEMTALLETEQKWKKENERRRWNYIPFAINLMRELSSGGYLQSLLSKEREKANTQRNEKANSQQQQKQQRNEKTNSQQQLRNEKKDLDL